MFYSDNPIADYERYSANQEKELQELPICSVCDEPIQDEYCYVINDEVLCESCLNYHHRKWTEDIIQT